MLASNCASLLATNSSPNFTMFTANNCDILLKAIKKAEANQGQRKESGASYETNGCADDTKQTEFRSSCQTVAVFISKRSSGSQERSNDIVKG